MKKARLLIPVIISVVLAVLLFVLYKNNDSAKNFFDGTYSTGNTSVVIGTEEEQLEAVKAAEEQEQKYAELMGTISLAALTFVTILQIFAFFIAFFTFSDIKKSKDSVSLKLANMENAELFLDIPLYFGLFGTVLSFSLITFNPQMSRLVAYSSTLIGIVFSVFLRLTLQYPLKRALLLCADKEAR